MNKAVIIAARLTRAVHRVWERKWSFFAVFAGILIINVGTLASFDVLPERISAQAALVTMLPLVVGSHPETVVEPIVLPEAPIRMTVESIGLDVTIANPTSTAVEVLDAALLSGAVRYPTSARLGENGNVVVFGHSSYLPVVHNQAFKAFDGIQDLQTGETITVYSANRFYIYAVLRVVKVKAEDGTIPLKVSGHILTLATCDSFGTKSDRFVVTAEFVESGLISS